MGRSAFPSHENGVLLEFRKVWREYPLADGGTVTALRDVSFRLRPAQRVAVMGRSGSGKSTLLHLAAGVDVPSRGEVRLAGRALADLSDDRRARLRRETVGLVFQFFFLMGHLSVLENVCLPGYLAGDPAEALRRRGRELLARVGLRGWEDRPADRLSGGEMQRVALCRALLRHPMLVLADEPTGSLDDESGSGVLDLLFEACETEGAAMMLVTHSEAVASRADAVWSLRSGRLELP